MDTITLSPGPAAAQAFRLGIIASAVCGLAGIATLYWLGVLTPVFAGYVLVLLFPVYLVFAATALSVWLGYNKDATALRPVYRQQESSGRSE
ncbi:hypothetical protein [Haloarcula japonica]|uniref:Uncharacterized protein n=1 Tax=Haloarcula japonica (strain ATCC 49778 / DSM 6131 / JCM 7785 / NBRC 101032 / NCIMB 13157 / TR-1) TaxID=1227453 RepID=M0L5R1_HALJT|nr:hypothetical protein [Haloarcula japonica]EMA27779.1 hypothetical protein C444_19882 [Haloarcula japonica DSM 6131]